MTATVYTSVDEYPEEFLRCRGTKQHTWDFKTDWNLTSGPRGRLIEFTRTRVCLSCGSKTHVVFGVEPDGTFVWKYRRYEYADGYVIRRGSGLDPSVLRDELFLREIKESLGDEILARLVKMRRRADAAS